VNAADQLDREWPLLTQRPLRQALPDWQRKQPQLCRFSSVPQLLRFLHTTPPADTNEPLLALLTLARSDQLAGRFLLQAILPALKSQAKRIVHPVELRDELWELLLFYAWDAIRNYPVERRRRSVAANLVLQVLHDTTRELRRANAHHSHEVTGPLYGYALRTIASPTSEQRVMAAPGQPVWATALDAETFILATVAAGRIGEEDADLILRTRIDGIPLRAIASLLGVGYDALRKRRQRAERHLRALLVESGHVPTVPEKGLIASTAGKHNRRRPDATPRPHRRPLRKPHSSPDRSRKETPMRRRMTFASACTYTALCVLVLAPNAFGATTDLNTVIDNLKLWLTGLLASLATVFLITGAARYVMAGGDPIKIERAKSAISSAGLGYAFALFAPVVVTIIQQIVGGGPACSRSP
jgi:DNA-directed RNA polymerase specialized sigma24 family protein